MKVEVITTYYREEFLAPLFLLHYESWVDRITFLSNKFEDGRFDDVPKADWINAAIARSDADWVIAVDMDEFVFPRPYGSSPRLALEAETGQIMNSGMVRVWRHRTDLDIDRMQNPILQRRHGQKDHTKPCIFRPRGVSLDIGGHAARVPEHYQYGTLWGGAHWANADPCFWLDRGPRDRGMRLSERNIAAGHGTHNLRTKEQILSECEAHLDDPQLI